MVISFSYFKFARFDFACFNFDVFVLQCFEVPRLLRLKRNSMESFVQALGKRKAECSEFSTLKKIFVNKIRVDGLGNIATLGSNIVTLK